MPESKKCSFLSTLSLQNQVAHFFISIFCSHLHVNKPISVNNPKQSLHAYVHKIFPDCLSGASLGLKEIYNSQKDDDCHDESAISVLALVEIHGQVTRLSVLTSINGRR